jgi:NADH-quinone oxidoreductase subunit H
MKILLNFLVFPGLLTAVCVGLLAGWFDRKISARLQWRVGPPWYQNFIDIAKLFGKETIIPRSSRWTFILSPYLGFLSLVLAATVLGKVMLWPSESFYADIIVILYLLTMPAVSMMIGASSSRNPLASVGASREMKLILGYELPFILSLIAVIIRCQDSIQLGSIINYQASFGSNIFSFSGVLAFIAAFFAMQAKLGFAPFDISEAEQEIMGGTLIEYSGPLLAVFKLTKAVLLYTMPLLLICLFMGKDLGWMLLIPKYIGIVLLAVLIKNTNPRIRIDQALRFFWGPVTIMAVISVILAAVGL